MGNARIVKSNGSMVWHTPKCIDLNDMHRP